MKAFKQVLFLFFIILLFPVICFSQNDSTSQNDTAIYTIVQQMPVFVGGQDAMVTFIRENLVYPKKERKTNITGTCFISFVVEKDGAISNIKVMRGVKSGKGCDDEAVRVISIMPKWAPGKQNGRAVRVNFILPIKFTLR